MGWDELGKMAENCNSGDGCSAMVLVLATIAKLIHDYPLVALPILGGIFYVMYKNAQPKEPT